MTRFLPTVAAFAAAAIAFSTFSSPAYAEKTVTENVTIKFDTRNLSTSGNVNQALADIERQAREVCTFTQPIVRTEVVDTACVADVMDQVVVQINSAPLTEAHNRTKLQLASIIR